MNRLKNGGIAVGAPGSPARIKAEAEDYANGLYPAGCKCINNGDWCDWHEAYADWMNNDESWREEQRT